MKDLKTETPTKSHEELLPPLSVTLSRLLSPIHRIFDRLYHSQYNPLYRSGTLAVGMLVILVITGLYLICFYSVSQPYESVQAIQAQVYLGRWVRAVHRYATDVMILATVFHVLQLLAQGKTWGPRVLPWVSGVGLVVLLYLSAWSGYVMVWDMHGQLLAMAGAEMLGQLWIFRDAAQQAFNGSTPVAGSFFFMNLFLHVAVPIALLFGIWVHTAKISRTRWLPRRPIFVTVTFALIVLAVLWPAPLAPKADLLQLVNRVPVDLFTGFWLPFVSVSASTALGCAVVTTLFLALLPYWWRPRAQVIRGTSVVDIERCTGCTQCAHDCPYEAITMIPREDGRRLVAVVSPGSCVSCGICSASCADLAIGPPQRSGLDQERWIHEQLASDLAGLTADNALAFVCLHNGAAPAAWQAYVREHPDVHVRFVDCCGTVHTQTMEAALEHCGNVFLHACPERNCFNRDGLDLATQRIWYKRVPFLARGIDRGRLAISAASDAELGETFALMEKLQRRERNIGAAALGIRRLARESSRVFATSILCVFVAASSQIPFGEKSASAVLRVAARLPGRVSQECRPLTAEERLTLPLHMQKPQICKSEALTYRLVVRVDNVSVADRIVSQSGTSSDSPLLVNFETNLAPGAHAVDVAIQPNGSADQPANSLVYSGSSDFAAGQILLLVPSDDGRGLIPRR